MAMRHFGYCVLLLLLSACSAGIDTKVDEPRAQVLARLADLPKDADVFELGKQFPNTEYVVATTSSTVMWIFKQDGKDACRFVATVEELGPSSSQVTTRLQDDSKGAERYICKVVKIVGEESVGAALARRPADVAAVNSQIKQFVVTDYAAIVDSVSKRMDEMAPPRDDNCQNGSLEQREGCVRLKKAFEERRKNAPPLPSGSFN